MVKINDHKCMFTVVSGFIELIGGMKVIPKHKISSINSITIPSSFRDLAQTLAGYYLVQNHIIASS